MANQWTEQAVLAIARQYSTISEWIEKSRNSYIVALRRKWHKKCTAHMARMVPRPPTKWTKDAVLADAKKYQTKSDWMNSSVGYKIARKKGWLRESCSHMPSTKKKWSDHDLISQAQQFKHISDWRAASGSLYHCATRRDIYRDCVKHMIDKPVWNLVWTKESVLKEALRFKTLRDWRIKSDSSYQSASRNNWLDEATKHMKRSGPTSQPEQQLQALIKAKYPKAQTNFKIRLKKPLHGHIHGFELDIYIPELRKGIEFNGTYWHSFKGLRKGRNHWPEPLLKSYHSIKREFFQSHGIEYMEIWEQDWERDSDTVVKQALQFLGNHNG